MKGGRHTQLNNDEQAFLDLKSSRQLWQHTLSLNESEETDEAEDDEECCWGLERHIRESALCGDTESLCCSSESPPNWTTIETQHVTVFKLKRKIFAI